MANGGIVGYAGPDGSQVGMKPTLGAVPPSAVGDEQIKQFAAQYTALQAGLAAATTPEDKAQSQRLIQDLIRDMGNQHATVMQYIDSTKGFVAPRTSGMARGGIIGYFPGGDVMLDTKYGPVPSYSPDSAAFLANRDAERAAAQGRATAKSDLLRTLSREEATRFASLIQELGNQDQALSIIAEERKRPDVGNVAGIARMLAGQKESPFRVQGIEEVEKATPTVGTQYDPTGTESVGIPFGTAQDTFVPAVGALATAPVAPQEFTPDALDLLAEGKLTDALNADPDTAATTRGDRLRELTGLDDLMARRIESEKAVRAQKESRLTPEETRKRRIQAGLAGLAERGLGGFGAGRTSEMDKIAAERLGIEETSLADLNSLIAEKRAMGMTQFEAENSARAEIQGSQDNAATAAGRRRDARLTAFEAAERDRRNIEATATQGELNRANQLAIAELNALRPTDFMNEIKIRVDALQAGNPGLSDVDARSQALEARIEDQTRAQLAAAGIRANSLELDRLKAAYSMAGTKLANRFDLTTDPEAFNTAFRNEVKNIMEEIGTVSSGGIYPPMPTERSQLVRGTIYSTSQGNARWNGTNFIPVN
jgi:hypothetical protein